MTSILVKRSNYPDPGFTLIELMIIVIVTGVLAAVALPAFATLIKNNRLALQANTVMASLNYARNKSINQGETILLQPIIAGTDWSNGWQASINGIVVRHFDAIEGGTLASSAKTITYEITGNIAGMNTITLTLTANKCTSGKSYIRVITIIPSGSAKITRQNCK